MSYVFLSLFWSGMASSQYTTDYITWVRKFDHIKIPPHNHLSKNVTPYTRHPPPPQKKNTHTHKYFQTSLHASVFSQIVYLFNMSSFG